MINKRLTSFLTIFTLLFTLIPFNMFVSASGVSVPSGPQNGRLVLFDFGYGSDGNLGTDTADAYRQMSTEVKDTGKTSSLLWTFPETANLNVEVHLDYQRKDWPEGADVKFRMYNAHTEANTFVLYFYTLETDYTPISRSYITLQPGWNTVTMSRSALDTAIPLENDIGVKFNVGGWRGSNKYVYTAGSKIYIDSAYIEFPNYGETTGAPVPSIENGAGYVAPDLENSNTYTLTFAEKLWNGSHMEDSITYNVSDYVTVYERSSSSYVKTFQSYDVSVNDNGGLDITFDGALDNAIYKVVANSDAILTASGKKLSQDAEYHFSVGLASVIFTASYTVPSDASAVIANEPGFEYIIKFNNDIDPFDLENMVSVSPDASYSVSSDDNYIKLTFTNALKSSTTYTVTLSDDFTDTNGSLLSGTKTFSFTTAKTLGSNGVIFDASSDEDLSVIPWKPSGTNFTIKKVSEGAFLGDYTIEFTKNDTTGLSYAFNLSDKVIPKFNNYNYVNILAYTGSSNDNSINVIFSGKDDNFTASFPTNWNGWKTVSVPLSSVTGTVGYTDQISVRYGFGKTAAKVYIDRVWLSADIPSPVNLVSSEFADGAYELEANLGGDNAYSFTFENNIKDFNLSDAVSIKKHNGTSYDDFTGYVVTAADNKLNVNFSPTLSGNATFNISLDLSKILSTDYYVGSGNIQREFTIGGAPTYFMLKETSVNNGATINVLSSVELEFNNKPDSALYIPEYIWVYKDGNKIYNSYEASLSDNKVILNFGDNMEPGEYIIKVSSLYKDIYGNSFSGSDSVSFTYESGENSDDTFVVFSAQTDADFNKLNNQYTKVTDTTNLFSQTAKLAYSAGLGGSSNVNGFINNKVQMNVPGMKYLNLVVYSPKETENTAHVVLYTDVANNKYGSMKHVLPLDWSGWKLISIPMSSFVQSNTYDAFLFNVGGWSYKDIYESSYVLIDAVWFSKELPAEMELVSSSFDNGYTGADIGGEILELKFNNPISLESHPSITFKDKNGTDVSDYTVNYNDTTMKFVFGELSPSTTYTLKVGDVMSANFTKLPEPVVIEFTTASDGIFTSNLTYSAKTVTANVKNFTSDAQSVTLTAYAISENNIVLEQQETTVPVVAGSETAITVTFATNGEIKEVKAFVRQNDYKFVSQKYLSYKNETASIITTSKLSAGKNIKIDSADVALSVICVKATLGGVSNGAVIEITANDGTVISANVVNADKNGIITYNCEFPESVLSGKYKVTVYSDDIKADVDILYVSKSDRDRLFNLANGTSQADLSACLTDLKDYIGISTYNSAKIADLAKVMISAPSFANYLEVYNFIKYYGALISKINLATWGELTLVIKNNSDTFKLLSSADIAYYTALTNEQQNKISQLLRAKLPQDTLSGFLNVLSNAITEFKNIPSQTPQYGSSPSVSGSGGSVASFPSASNANPYTPIEINKVFSDLADAAWATESIMILHKNGVVSNAADKKFRPNDNITREEFVKMIVCAFADDFATTDHKFADAADGAWYNTYLSKAYALGITKGYEDGSFGVGQNITREDMVTICARALEILGNSMTMTENMSFHDKSEISGYAYGYVNTMVNLGIVNGMGDGTFAPKQNATRAQAAKIVASLMELY